MITGIILAAGQGKRMKSPLPKVMHPVLGKPMVVRVIEAAKKAGMDDIVVVVGHGRDRLVPLLHEHGASWEVQDSQLGTAHAVSCGLDDRNPDEVVVLLGDVPLLTPETVRELLEKRRTENAAIAVLTTCPPDVSGYGRIQRSGECEITGIVEERDATDGQLAITEINTGLMAFDGTKIRELLELIDNSNTQNEYYLTDAVGIAAGRGMKAVAVKAPDWHEVAGVNNPEHLAEATSRLREITVRQHVLNGVVISDPDSIWIEDTVIIQPGSIIGSGCRLSGKTVIGINCRLGECCVIADSTVPDGSVLEAHTIMEEAGI